MDLVTSIYLTGYIMSPIELFLPDETTKQARMAAEYWMEHAAEFVEERLAQYPPAARAALIAAYIQAAARVEIATKLHNLANELSDNLRAIGYALDRMAPYIGYDETGTTAPTSPTALL